MKTNKIMRVASVLLVAVLLTTCVISGTFAKYVTTANVGDGARVAKWGIVLDSTGSATFKDSYDASVVSSGAVGDAVVAPGTQNSVTYNVTGTPETNYVVDFDYTGITELYLGAGTYTYSNSDTSSAYDNDMTQTVAANYYPVKFTITIATTNGTIAAKAGDVAFTANVASTEYDTLTAALDDLKNTKVSFDANEACDVVVTIAWIWDFEGQNDAYDTILGDLAASNADLAASAGADYSLNIAFDLTIRATQVD